MIRYILLALVLMPVAGVKADHIDLDKLLREVKQSQGREAKVNREREARFVAQRGEQKRLLDKTRAALQAQQARTESLKQAFEQNEQALEAMETELKGQSGELGELFGVVRQVAADTKAMVSNSITSAQFPDRLKLFESIATSKKIPTIGQLEELWYLLQQEMTEQGKVVKFPAKVISAAGDPRQTNVVRVGPFNIFADGMYLKYLPETGEMVELPRQPASRYQDLAESLDDAEGEWSAAGIDPTGGVILGMLVRAPSLLERIDQGGVIGYIILVLGVIGLIVAVVRMIDLVGVAKRVSAQLDNLTAIDEANPLGRVMAVAKGTQATDIESYELLIDEAVIREIPALEKGQSLVKLLAAVAPLLGLLGTVTGMIETFQSISLFGTGDPKLMAGGISQALVTTMLGLIVAIPLLFVHSLMANRSKQMVQILEEQSSGLICQSLENVR